EINYINTYFPSKSNIYNLNLSNLSEGTNSTQAKLLSTYQNIIKDSKDISEIEVSYLIVSCNIVDKLQTSSSVLDKNFSL
ncbi:9771_t:CDS:1, partial [Scutellospora calospora]